MSTALTLKVRSQLPAALNHVLATPSSTELEQLWWRYKAQEKQIRDSHEVLSSGKHYSALTYLMRSTNQNYEPPRGASLYNSNVDIAIKLLQADSWDAAIKTTDIREHMPAQRISEWNEQISTLSFPEFTLEALFLTLSELLNERDRFFAERVDGFYRKLSGDHLTNSINPMGFYKRMIIANVHDECGYNYRVCQYISDLRYVIGRFTNRTGGRISDSCTGKLIMQLNQRSGEWHDIDGGAIKIKVFKKGTAHIEVHPDLAWQLNEVLAILYPKAIGAQYRQKPQKAVKEYNLSQNLIGFDVLSVLEDLKPAYEFDELGRSKGRIKNTFKMFCVDKHLYAKCEEVLSLIGGVKTHRGQFAFDFDPSDVIFSILSSGMVPDHVSHQYYPTPEPLAEQMAGLLGALPGDNLLEPSAGQGGLAKFMKGNVTCIEISDTFCKILCTKGFNVIQDDFLAWQKVAKARHERFAGVLMNPPFSIGRAYEHVMAATELLDENGRLVALLPSATAEKFKASMTGGVEIIPVEGNEFPGVSIDMSIVKYSKQS